MIVQIDWKFDWSGGTAVAAHVEMILPKRGPGTALKKDKKSPPANWRAEGLLQQAC
jgi:hypothetical protein